jgi:hypothetical protein
VIWSRSPFLVQQILFPEHQCRPELIVDIFLLGEAMAFILAQQMPSDAALVAAGKQAYYRALEI